MAMESGTEGPLVQLSGVQTTNSPRGGDFWDAALTPKGEVL